MDVLSFFANPKRFESLARILAPLLGVLALALILFGLWLGLYNSPEDYQQGHSVRIMYVHVPAVTAGMMAYAGMAVFSLIFYIWRHPLADELAKACALPGAALTGLGLITGALWGKTSWGTFWQWDGRLTSTLILFFLFLGYLAIRAGIEDQRRAARIAGLIAMVGSINLPIIKFSVDWWNSLHQTASFSLFGGNKLPPEMSWPLFTMMAGYVCFLGWVVLSRVRFSIASAKTRRRRPKGATASLKTLEE